MREFNIFGPVHPEYHYHVDRVAVKAEIRQKIEQGRYFTLNAARQTGKTTLFRELTVELEATGDYFGLLLSFETFRDYSRAEFYEQIGQRLHTRNLPRLAQLGGDNLPPPTGLRHQDDFGDWLRAACRLMTGRGVLIIDEFDAIGETLAEPLLAMFRDMYLTRYDANLYHLQSIILVGVRNIPALLGGSQSPFNIADQYELPYFTQAETVDLLTQHTTETGQLFAPEVLTAIYRESEGQPFLVNRLGQLLTQQFVPQRQQPVTLPDFQQAIAQLLGENNPHFASITAKAMPHRAMLLPLLFYDERRTEYRDPATQTLIMYGVMRVISDQYGNKLARLANPIYRKRLILTFKPSANELHPPNGAFRHRYAINGTLDIDRLLTDFQQMMQEHGVTLLRSKRTYRPLELGGQYLLLSYLTAALNSIGGHVALEAVNASGEMDLLIFYQATRFIIETKLWYGKQRFTAGKQQVVAYLKAAGLDTGYIVLFSEQAVSIELTETLADKQLRIYPIVIK